MNKRKMKLLANTYYSTIDSSDIWNQKTLVVNVKGFLHLNHDETFKIKYTCKPLIN